MTRSRREGEMQKLAYSLGEISQLTALSVRSLRYLIREGRLAHVRVGRRILIRHDDLEAFLRKHRVKAAAAVDADAPIRPTACERDHVKA
jgi:excisionase family DNA binding protein